MLWELNNEAWHELKMFDISIETAIKILKKKVLFRLY
jgi:hypothetical protein